MNKKVKNFIFTTAIFAVLFVFILGIVYVFFNFPSLYIKIKYKLSPQETNLANSYKQLTAQSGNNSTKQEMNSREIIQDNTLIIPKIGVLSPIIWSKNNNYISQDLNYGVSHYPGTALPGDSGNALILGHSSNFWWDEGNYNNIFALLSELENNDVIFIYYKGKKYNYQVSEKNIINKSQINNAIKEPRTESALTLMTCWPLGSDLKRLSVKAILDPQK